MAHPERVVQNASRVRMCRSTTQYCATPAVRYPAGWFRRSFARVEPESTSAATPAAHPGGPRAHGTRQFRSGPVTALAARRRAFGSTRIAADADGWVRGSSVANPGLRRSSGPPHDAVLVWLQGVRPRAKRFIKAIGEDVQDRGFQRPVSRPNVLTETHDPRVPTIPGRRRRSCQVPQSKHPGSEGSHCSHGAVRPP